MTKYLKHKILYILCGFILVSSGCTKWDSLESPNEGEIYMPQAYADRSKLQVFKIDSPQVYNFGASLAGFKGAPADVHVTFEVDNSLLDNFNRQYAYLNYDFVKLPEDAFEIPALETQIKKGKSDSDPLSFSLFANKLDRSLDYCLPVRIKSVSEGSIDTLLSIAYFMVDSLYIRSKDITGLGQLSVSNENPGGPNAGEGSVRLTDNDYTTKYLFFNFTPGAWMKLKLNAPSKLNAYTLTSGNDAPERDPKDWELQGSNDGENWTTLDARTGYSFPSRLQTHTFELNQPDGQSYLYYRLVLQQINGANLFQLTEWRIIQYY